MNRQPPKKWQKKYDLCTKSIPPIRPSYRVAIRVFCLQCVGWKYDDVTKCTDNGCPLYLVRRPPTPR
jgi:hypothetical protein